MISLNIAGFNLIYSLYGFCS